MKNDKKTGITNYPIGDFLIRIKNASLAKRKEVVVNKTRYLKSVALLLQRIGYLEKVKDEENKLIVNLSYKKKEPVLTNIELISKPGLRMYIGVEELEKIKSPSIFILSTSAGVISSKDAIKKRLGGELIAKIL